MTPPDWSVFSDVIGWMRSQGVARMRVADIEIELGMAPSKPEEIRPLTADELTALEERLKEEQEDLLFASAGGFRPPRANR